MMVGGFEGENPTRRYKWFRPRQAARGAISFLSGSNASIGGLFNNSNAAQYLVVRHWVSESVNQSNLDNGVAYLQGMPGTVAGVVSPLVPGSGALPGQMWYQDASAAPQPDMLLLPSSGLNSVSAWPHDFPIAVLPPGWSLIATAISSPGVLVVGCMWEAIYSEELDYLY